MAILKFVVCHGGAHTREIAEKLGANPATVHNAIKLFKKMGFVLEKKEKNRKIITANKDSLLLKKIKSLLNVFEMQKKEAFGKLQKYGKVGLYGSFASGEDTPKSDIDMWVYSGKKLDAAKLKGVTRELEKDFGREVKLLILDDEKIKRMKEKDPEFYFRLKLTSVGGDIFG